MFVFRCILFTFLIFILKAHCKSEREGLLDSSETSYEVQLGDSSTDKKTRGQAEDPRMNKKMMVIHIFLVCIINLHFQSYFSYCSGIHMSRFASSEEFTNIILKGIGRKNLYYHLIKG